MNCLWPDFVKTPFNFTVMWYNNEKSGRLREQEKAVGRSAYD